MPSRRRSGRRSGRPAPLAAAGWGQARTGTPGTPAFPRAAWLVVGSWTNDAEHRFEIVPRTTPPNACRSTGQPTDQPLCQRNRPPGGVAFIRPVLLVLLP